MKLCEYCGRENDDVAPVCRECGTSLDGVESKTAAKVPLSRPTKIICAILAAIGGSLLFCGGILFVIGLGIRGCDPSTPRSGYKGDWKAHTVFGVEDRPLPPAKDIWREYLSWKPATNPHTERLFTARLGGADRQSAFHCMTNFGDTPMGAHHYTHIDFLYHDPTNGTYALSWYMRGKHDPGFLRFDDTQRFYQLLPSGDTNESPPKLFIRAIEGMKAHQ